MSTDKKLAKAANHIDGLLNLPRQIWLLGAGVSKDAGIPLMYPLTDRVEALLGSTNKELGEIDTLRSHSIYEEIRKVLPEEAHVEHVLSYLGDLISLGERKSEKTVSIKEMRVSTVDLREAHHHIQLAIRHTVEYGYYPKSDGVNERIGTADLPVVTPKYHQKFVRALFRHRRAGLEQNPSVRFFTTNYDTLLEDALAFSQVPFVDGFAGGGSAFWDPKNNELRLTQATRHGLHSAFVYKLHGSIDWIIDDDDIVMRVRSSTTRTANSRTTRLLIYPQATKYQVTQRDPFATLFSEFRRELDTSTPSVCVICGYSFGDEHINEEIERAMRQRSNTLTLLALCSQRAEEGVEDESDGLPTCITKWLRPTSPWRERIIVAGKRGFYRGSLVNQLEKSAPMKWWTFDGITNLLSDGPEALL